MGMCQNIGYSAAWLYHPKNMDQSNLWVLFAGEKKTVNSQMFFQRPKQPSLYFFPSFREVDGKHLKNNWLGSSYLLNTNLLFNEVNGK